MFAAVLLVTQIDKTVKKVMQKKLKLKTKNHQNTVLFPFSGKKQVNINSVLNLKQFCAGGDSYLTCIRYSQKTSLGAVFFFIISKAVPSLAKQSQCAAAYAFGMY